MGEVYRSFSNVRHVTIQARCPINVINIWPIINCDFIDKTYRCITRHLQHQPGRSSFNEVFSSLAVGYGGLRCRGSYRRDEEEEFSKWRRVGRPGAGTKTKGTKVDDNATAMQTGVYDCVHRVRRRRGTHRWGCIPPAEDPASTWWGWCPVLVGGI